MINDSGTPKRPKTLEISQNKVYANSTFNYFIDNAELGEIRRSFPDKHQTAFYTTALIGTYISNFNTLSESTTCHFLYPDYRKTDSVVVVRNSIDLFTVLNKTLREKVEDYNRLTFAPDESVFICGLSDAGTSLMKKGNRFDCSNDIFHKNPNVFQYFARNGINMATTNN